MEYLPLVENGYQPILELLDHRLNVLKDNLNDIKPKDVKMFSLQDIQDAWYDCYGEYLNEEYSGFYNNLKLKIG